MRRMRLAGGLGGGNDRSRERTRCAARDTTRRRGRGAHPSGFLRARVPQESKPLRPIQREGMPSEGRTEILGPPEKPHVPAGLQNHHHHPPPKARVFPLRSREVQLKILFSLRGRSAPEAPKSPHSGRCPASRAGEDRKDAPQAPAQRASKLPPQAGVCLFAGN